MDQYRVSFADATFRDFDACGADVVKEGFVVRLLGEGGAVIEAFPWERVTAVEVITSDVSAGEVHTPVVLSRPGVDPGLDEWLVAAEAALAEAQAREALDEDAVDAAQRKVDELEDAIALRDGPGLLEPPAPPTDVTTALTGPFSVSPTSTEPSVETSTTATTETVHHDPMPAAPGAWPEAVEAPEVAAPDPDAVK